MPTAEVRRYWTQVASLGCVVCKGLAEVAHCAGKPSVSERLQEPKAKGMKLPRMDWIVLPVCAWHHRMSVDALDLNPRLFEQRYGTVAGHIDKVAEKLGVDVWAKAKEGKK